MNLIRRILTTLRPARARYGAEVLFAGWVDLPWGLKSRKHRRPG